MAVATMLFGGIGLGDRLMCCPSAAATSDDEGRLMTAAVGRFPPPPPPPALLLLVLISSNDTREVGLCGWKADELVDSCELVCRCECVPLGDATRPVSEQSTGRGYILGKFSILPLLLAEE